MSLARSLKKVVMRNKRAKKKAKREAEALRWYGISHGVVKGPLAQLHDAGLCNNNWHDCPTCMINRMREREANG